MEKSDWAKVLAVSLAISILVGLGILYLTRPVPQQAPRINMREVENIVGTRVAVILTAQPTTVPFGMDMVQETANNAAFAVYSQMATIEAPNIVATAQAVVATAIPTYLPTYLPTATPFDMAALAQEAARHVNTPDPAVIAATAASYITPMPSGVEQADLDALEERVTTAEYEIDAVRQVYSEDIQLIAQALRQIEATLCRDVRVWVSDTLAGVLNFCGGPTLPTLPVGTPEPS